MDSDDNYVDTGNVSTGEYDDMEVDVPIRESTTETDEYHYDVLPTDQIVQLMNDLISEVVNVIDIPATTTRILLHYFKWDKETLMERYFDDNEGKLFSDAHVINPKWKPIIVGKPKVTRSGAKECEICFLIFPANYMTGLECGHKFCTDCYAEYITTKIMEEGIGQSITCPANDCDILVDDVTVMKLVKDSKVKLKYQYLITNSFVECNRLLRWCPSVDCTYAIKVAYTDPRPVRCKCGHYFCFECGENCHEPIHCTLLKRWTKQCNEDSGSSSWIATNTKLCPKCKVNIEKNGGCNHMVCKNQNCKHEFCWMCLGSAHGHDNNCNRFNEAEAKATRDVQAKLKSSLTRYLHYYNRYMNHMQSFKLENKLYASVEQKMEEMQQMRVSLIEAQFLKKAVDILCQCRQTLMHTYVFAYYLSKNNQSMIFEDNQNDLETATERLSEYLERDITSGNLADIKHKVQDKYRYCEKRRNVLLDHVHEGYGQNWWLYTE